MSASWPGLELGVGIDVFIRNPLPTRYGLLSQVRLTLKVFCSLCDQQRWNVVWVLNSEVDDKAGGDFLSV